MNKLFQISAKFIGGASCKAAFLVRFVGPFAGVSFLTIRVSWPPKSFRGILQAGKMVMTSLSVLWTPRPFQMDKKINVIFF